MTKLFTECWFVDTWDDTAKKWRTKKRYKTKADAELYASLIKKSGTKVRVEKGAVMTI